MDFCIFKFWFYMLVDIRASAANNARITGIASDLFFHFHRYGS